MTGLPKFMEKSSSANLDLKMALIDKDNTILYLQAKIAKLERTIQENSTKVISKPSEVLPESQKMLNQKKFYDEMILAKDKKLLTQRSAHEAVIKSMVKKMSKITEATTIKHQELAYLRKRIVAVYGNQALINLWAHVDNPHFVPQDLEGMKNIKPIF